MLPGRRREGRKEAGGEGHERVHGSPELVPALLLRRLHSTDHPGKQLLQAKRSMGCKKRRRWLAYPSHCTHPGRACSHRRTRRGGRGQTGGRRRATHRCSLLRPTGVNRRPIVCPLPLHGVDRGKVVRDSTFSVCFLAVFSRRTVDNCLVFSDLSFACGHVSTGAEWHELNCQSF